ncbi:MAG TPA: sialidase family protein [Chthonomonadaceae bacterium]|nr:sialidase family protein [Chthonomonadaceae bacterium]
MLYRYPFSLGVLALLTSLIAILPRSPGQRNGEAPPITVGPNVQVSAVRARINHAEVTLAADPTNPKRMLASAMYYPEGVAGSKVVGYMSGDGGKTWELSFERLEEAKRMGLDPAVAYGPDGTAYCMDLSVQFPEKEPATPEEEAKAPKFGDPDVGYLHLAHSRDGGKTWAPISKLNRWIDRPWLTVDRSTGKYRGRLYCVGSIGQPLLYTSDDKGQTFSSPHLWSVKPGYWSFGIGNPVTLSDGTLIALYDGYIGSYAKDRTPYLAVRRSTDGGVSFGDEALVGNWNVQNNPQLCLPAMAVDSGSTKYRDRLYVVWAEERESGLQVRCSYSKDRGASWSKPVLLSEQPEGKAGEKTYNACIPSVAVNKAGAVAVLWYDQRGLPSDGKGWNVRLRVSPDGGETWLPSVQVNKVTSEKASLALLGHTSGLAADAEGVFHPLWIDNRTGVLQVWTAAVTVTALVSI